MFLIGTRAGYFLEFSNSAIDGSFGVNGVALQISRANLGSCPDAMAFVRVTLTVWTTITHESFGNSTL